MKTHICQTVLLAFSVGCLSSCSSPVASLSSDQADVSVSDATSVVRQFRSSLEGSRVSFDHLWNDRVARTGGFEEAPENIRMYDLLRAVRNGITDLSEYDRVCIDIPLEMVDSVHTRNHTSMEDLLGKTVSQDTIQSVCDMDLLTALSLCAEVYTLGVSVDGRSVHMYFPRYSKQFQPGIKIPLLFKDSGIVRPSKKPTSVRNADDSWLESPVKAK